MLRLENTPNLLGVKIKGDKIDMQALYEAISRYTECFYEDSIAALDQQCKAELITEKQLQHGYQFYGNKRDCFLGLMYDIRHAWQGDRDYEYVDNGADNIGRLAECIYVTDTEKLADERFKGENGNLYFGVDILYPWALYYLVNLTVMLDLGVEPQRFQKSKNTYTEFLCREDQCLLEWFNMELWKCISEIVGEKKACCLLRMTDIWAEEISFGDTYIEVLCEYYCDRKKKGIRLHKAMLFAMLYDLIDGERMVELAGFEKLGEQGTYFYREAAGYILEKTGEPFLSHERFWEKLREANINWEIMTDEEWDAFLESFGTVDWDRLEM